jgi:hypothetical protein
MLRIHTSGHRAAGLPSDEGAVLDSIVCPALGQQIDISPSDVQASAFSYTLRRASRSDRVLGSGQRLR